MSERAFIDGRSIYAPGPTKRRFKVRLVVWEVVEDPKRKKNLRLDVPGIEVPVVAVECQYDVGMLELLRMLMGKDYPSDAPEEVKQSRFVSWSTEILKHAVNILVQDRNKGAAKHFAEWLKTR